jgi:hypothetical protein
MDINNKSNIESEVKSEAESEAERATANKRQDYKNGSGRRNLDEHINRRHKDIYNTQENINRTRLKYIVNIIKVIGALSR